MTAWHRAVARIVEAPFRPPSPRSPRVRQPAAPFAYSCTGSKRCGRTGLDCKGRADDRDAIHRERQRVLPALRHAVRAKVRAVVEVLDVHAHLMKDRPSRNGCGVCLRAPVAGNEACKGRGVRSEAWMRVSMSVIMPRSRAGGEELLQRSKKGGTSSGPVSTPRNGSPPWYSSLPNRSTARRTTSKQHQSAPLPPASSAHPP